MRSARPGDLRAQEGVAIGCPADAGLRNLPQQWRFTRLWSGLDGHVTASGRGMRGAPTSRMITATADVALRDGSTVSLRPGVESDVQALTTFLQSLSTESLYFRFMGIPALTPDRVRALVTRTGGPTVSILAEAGGDVVGFAGYHKSPVRPGRAEAAFVVSDALQGHGIGTRLLESLAREARAEGITTFDAYVLGGNHRMFQVFRDSGLRMTNETSGAGVCHVSLDLEVTEDFAARSATRSRTAAKASIDAFFEPRVVAVVGASRTRGKIGSEILHNLIAGGYAGRIVPVHARAPTIAGLHAYARVSDIPDAVDLAIIAVPAAQVLAVVDDCIVKKVRAMCVISAGFSECGDEGRAREAALLDRVRRAGCRLIGPNCMGLLNTDPHVRLNATFSPIRPPAGSVAMSTQSGALGLAILSYARQLNIGISSFVSIGNKADVSGNDLLQYWADDPRTTAILLYVESFGNPKKFSEIARAVGRVKPIVAVKAGRSAAGSRAAASHTGALASSDAVVDALFRQCGVIRTDRLEELFDVAALVTHQPVPTGRRVAILTNAGGPGILAADACEAQRLALPALSEATQSELRRLLPAEASIGNPVDMLASATADHYEKALTAILRDDHIDSVITIFIPPLVTAADAVAVAVSTAARRVPGKPVLGVFMQTGPAPATLESIPTYAFPESAALALARVTEYGEWRATPIEPAPRSEGIDRDRIRALVDQVLGRGGGWANVDETAGILAATGIPVITSRTATNLEHALEAAARIGYPVALKAAGPAFLHKTERRAVCLNVKDPSALRAAYEDFQTRFRDDLQAVVVQQMARAGIEMIVGVVQDPSFGPVIACGMGGVLVDILADMSFRLPPLTARDAHEMIDNLRGARLLRGYRGAPVADEATLRDVLLRISQLATLAPEIREIDLNPLLVHHKGVTVVDARARIDTAEPIRRSRRVEY